MLGINGTGMLHAQDTQLNADLAEELESLESEQETEEQIENELEKDYVEIGIKLEFLQKKLAYWNRKKIALTARELNSIDPPPERI
ncbi:MAG: hypothetical protein AAFR87_35845 [Bacteroidota bacterium]